MPRDPKDRLIVALDVDSIDRAVGLVDALAGQVSRFKIGSQLFTAFGPPAVEAVRKRGGEVFLDLKFHDIPNTVDGAAREAVRLGVFMFNVHASGGRAMMQAAAHGAAEAAHTLGVARPLVLAVTVLTSFTLPLPWKATSFISARWPGRRGSTATSPHPTRCAQFATLSARAGPSSPRACARPVGSARTSLASPHRAPPPRRAPTIWWWDAPSRALPI